MVEKKILRNGGKTRSPPEGEGKEKSGVVEEGEEKRGRKPVLKKGKEVDRDAFTTKNIGHQFDSRSRKGEGVLLRGWGGGQG